MTTQEQYYPLGTVFFVDWKDYGVYNPATGQYEDILPLGAKGAVVGVKQRDGSTGHNQAIYTVEMESGRKVEVDGHRMIASVRMQEAVRGLMGLKTSV